MHATGTDGQGGMKLICGINMAGALSKIKKEGKVTKKSTFVASNQSYVNVIYKCC